MKLKSYLRGLGLGIIVTTIILVIAFNKRNVGMTDSDIVSRAYELGMVETSLYGNGDENEDSQEIPDDSPQQNNTETSGEGMVDPDNNQEMYVEPQPVIPAVTTEEPAFKETTPAETKETTTQNTVATTVSEETQGEIMIIVFDNITSATKASTILYEAGLISDVQDFNDYLTQQGWVTRVSEGTFEFRMGMTYEEIAKIITRQN